MSRPGIVTLVLSLLAFLFPATSTARPVAINEVVASNSATLADEDGDYEDWIELYNFGDEPVSLEGYGLSDNFGRPFRWVFPGVVIESGEFLLVWASGKDRRDPGGELHTNFRIAMAGEEVLLTDPSGARVDEIQPTVIPTDISYGRWPDGTGDWLFFDEPTPGGSNSTGPHTEILEPPVFSRPGGFYSEALELSISHPDESVIIVYTLDGSPPDPDNLEGAVYAYKNSYPEKPGQTPGETRFNSYRSRLYSGPLVIEDRSPRPDKLTRMSSTWHHDPDYFPRTPVRKGVVVRAGAFKPGALAGPVVTHTYFIDPAGIRSGLPVISLSIGEDAFFDYHKGIYVAGEDFDRWSRDHPDAPAGEGAPANYRRRGARWEYPAHLELFPPGASSAALSQGLGVRIHGGESRAYRAKSLRLYARNRYGKSDLAYPFFPDPAGDSFRRLLLRNSGQDSFLTLFRDAAIQAIAGRLDFDTQAYRPAVLFVNGEYWGIHNIRERYDKHYLARVYGVDPDNLDILEGNAEVEEGDALNYTALLEYIRANDISLPEHYSYVRTRIDTGNFIDYQAAQIFAANTDWPGNNIRFWRSRTDRFRSSGPPGRDGRWRWLLYDTDYGFGGVGGAEAAGRDTLTLATAPDGPARPNPPWSTFLLRSLLENDDFKYDFINRFADLLNTAFRPERTVGIINRLRAAIAPEIPAHLHRWGVPEDWEDNVEVTREFARRRPGYQRLHLRQKFGLEKELQVTLDVSDPRRGHLRINTVEIREGAPGISGSTYPWTGTYFSSVPIELEAVPAPGYAFSRWEGLEGVNGPVARIIPGEDISVTAHFR